MAYGLHIAKDDGSGFFSYSGFSFIPRHMVMIPLAKEGLQKLTIPAAPSGFTYTIVPAPIATLEYDYVGPYSPPSGILDTFIFPMGDFFNPQHITELAVTDSGEVSYVGSPKSKNPSYFFSDTYYYVYLRGK